MSYLSWNKIGHIVKEIVCLERKYIRASESLNLDHDLRLSHFTCMRLSLSLAAVARALQQRTKAYGG